jgi:hypothetical protein
MLGNGNVYSTWRVLGLCTWIKLKAQSAMPDASTRFSAPTLPGAKPAPFPGFIAPCLAPLRTKVPTTRGFVHELKVDWYRYKRTCVMAG